MDLYLCLVTLVQVFYFGCCFPNGAPISSCEDMMPGHIGVQPQPKRAPYSILVNTRVFKPGQTITVTITGPEYRGVLLEARTESSNIALGTWQLPPPDTKFLQCTGNPQGAITHSNTNLKGNATAFTWVPPRDTRSVHFIATIAQQRSIYWLNVRSSCLTKVGVGNGLATDGGSELMSRGLLLLAPSFLISQMLPILF